MTVCVRYYAGAKAAAGVAEEPAAAATLDALVNELARRHGPRLGAVLQASTFLVDGRPMRAGDALRAGTTLEVLPPFAGG